MIKLYSLRFRLGVWLLVIGSRIADLDLDIDIDFDCDCDDDHDELAWEDCGEEGCCA